MYYKRDLEARSRNCRYRAKAIIIITYSECEFVALGIQHAMRMRSIVICGLPRSTNVSALSHNGTILGKNLLNTKCVF
jgi:hypothetical protein